MITYFGDNMELDKNIREKVSNIFKECFNKPDFELNYLITDDIITFFYGINEGMELPEEVIDKISSTLDGSFEGSSIVNQEYRYKFNLKPCVA